MPESKESLITEVIWGSNSGKQFFSNAVGIGSKSQFFVELSSIIFLISSSFASSRVSSVLPKNIENSGAGGSKLSKVDLIRSILSVKKVEKLSAFSESVQSGRGDDFFPKPNKMENNSLHVFTVDNLCLKKFILF